MISSASILDDANALKCELAAEVLRSSGRLRLRVTGWSMLPTIMPGDTLTIEQTSPNGISVGEIVLFGRDRRLFVHRVIAQNSGCDRIVTGGDAMPGPDMPISETDLLGRLTSIARNGISIQPRRSLHLLERVIATLVRRSTFAARVTMRVSGLLQFFRQSLRQVSDFRASAL
jgi:signal peptidase I